MATFSGKCSDAAARRSVLPSVLEPFCSLASLPRSSTRSVCSADDTAAGHVRVIPNVVAKQPSKPKYEFLKLMLYAEQLTYDGALRRRGCTLASRPNSRNG